MSEDQMNDGFSEQERRTAEYKPTGHTYVHCAFCGRVAVAYSKKGRAYKHYLQRDDVGESLWAELGFDYHEPSEECPGSRDIGNVIPDEDEIYISPVGTLKVVRVQ